VTAKAPPVAVTAAVLVLAVGAARAAEARPHVTLLASRPVAVMVTGFHARERVTVEVRRASGRARRTVTADARGRLAVTFARVRASRCAALTIVATGASGARAALRRRPAQACGVP
jgi:hypothetical protein